MHSHIICIRVDAAAEGAVYEVIAGHRSSEGKFSRRIVSTRPKAQPSPVSSSSPKASPGAHPIILNYDTYIYVSITCALGLEIVWNPSCMIPRFS